VQSVLSGPARHLDAEDRPDMGQADLGHQALKPVRLRTGARAGRRR
jgi:hypothetical protein